MSNDVAKTSHSFFFAGFVLTLFATFSFFSPLASRTDTSWAESAARASAHFLPVLPAFIVGLALRYSQLWGWYAGLFYMAAIFSLGVYFSMEYFVYLANGYFLAPVFLLLSLVSLPSLYFLLRGRLRVLRQLRSAGP